MSNATEFLVEIGTEELPPKALRVLAEAFSVGLGERLKKLNLSFEAINSFATPRRLAVIVVGLARSQPDTTIERRGPNVAAAFDNDGKPTKAALGFANSCGTTVEQLGRVASDKGEWLVYAKEEPGKPAGALLPGAVEQALKGLPIPKRMRWGDGAVEFVRPVHWVVMLHGADVIDCTILGIRSGRRSYGHRFHHPGPIDISEAADYATLLAQQGSVICDFDRRRKSISDMVERCATEQGGRAVVESALLDEVTALVEWPVAVCGSFDEPFLELPREVLVASMQDHQKYFPVERPDGRLENKFITIANIDSRDIEVVRHGNERVIRPRLSDAAFFWEQDQKVPLADRLQNLDGIVFEQSLGTVLDKSRRVETLAGAVAEAFGADRGLAERAALLSRCDLLTEMVREFPELQGTMGGYYAARSGEPEDVVTATTQFYWPRFAGDTIPTTPVARAVACADKLDTLVGIFGIGAIPTGDKDPYGLRRAALGCLRIIIEGQAELDLEEALAVAVTGYGDKLPAASVAAAVLDFIAERLRHYYPDKGYDADVIDAVLAVGATRPLDIDRRIAAVAMFRALPEAADLSAANKRIANILRKAREDAANAVDTALFESDAEYRLESESARIESEARSSIDAGEYGPYLSRLAGIKDAVNLFFDDVMVMCDDEARRKNRLALLARVQKMFLKVADISRLAG